MRIAVISTMVFRLSGSGLGGYGGLEQIAWLCARGLASKGHQVMLIAPDGSECPGVQVIQCGPEQQVSDMQAYGGFSLDQNGWQRRHEGYWQHLLNVDVTIDHSWQKCSHLLKVEGRLKTPILTVCHAPVNTMFGELPPIPVGAVCISDDQRSHFEALFNRPARTCYNGVDMGYYRSTRAPRTRRFLFLARFSTIKGALLAIEACRTAGVGLDLIGDTQITNEPDYFQRCLSLADECTSPAFRKTKSYSSTDDKEKSIVIHGGVSRGETVHWYSQAHALIHPIRDFREPFGLAPVEAMACECPVISWKNGAMSETISSETGALVSSMDELVAVINVHKNISPEEDVYVRSKCRQQAEKFSVDRMVDRYEELCIEAIKAPW